MGEDLKKRTKRFALDVIDFVQKLKSNQFSKTLGNQLLRAGTSVGANYRAACRAKSTADFIYKIQIVIEEADESIYWLELLKESNLSNNPKLEILIREADELTAIFTTVAKKTKNKKST